MTNPNYCHLTFIVDRSGSMLEDGKDKEATNGIKVLLEEQFGLEGYLTVTLAQFDTSYERVKNMATEMFDYILIPRGGTALLDSVAHEITATGVDLAKMKEEDRPGMVIFVIVTDGEENASREFTLEQVKEMIRVQQDDYGWKFLFLGADTSVWLGQALGTTYATAYDNSREGTHAVYASTTEYLSSTRSGINVDMPDSV